jgi:SAM-dependent methyltransferase
LLAAQVVCPLIALMIGLISQELVPHAHKVIGLDTSQAMVDVYNQKATNNDISDKMHALCADILSSEIPPELQNVDVVVCSLAYHHIENIDHASKILASLLKKGGHLLVVDLLQGHAFSDLTDYRRSIRDVSQSCSTQARSQ